MSRVAANRPSALQARGIEQHLDPLCSLEDWAPEITFKYEYIHDGTFDNDDPRIHQIVCTGSDTEQCGNERTEPDFTDEEWRNLMSSEHWRSYNRGFFYKGAHDSSGMPSGFGRSFANIEAVGKCSSYRGQWKNGLYHGYGAEWDEHGWFLGNFVNGQRHGNGMLVSSVRSSEERSFFVTSSWGMFSKGALVGDAMLVYLKYPIKNNGAIGFETIQAGEWYKGPLLRNRLKHGIGRMAAINNTTVEYREGMFVHDKQTDPAGKIIHDDKRYEGGVVDDLCHGVGKLWTTHYDYTGEFKSGQFSGNGVRTVVSMMDKSSSGRHLDMDLLNKQSMVNREENYEYTGEFLNGQLHGSGIFKGTQGTFRGIWCQGVRCGTACSPSGREIQSTYHDGQVRFQFRYWGMMMIADFVHDFVQPVGVMAMVAHDDGLITYRPEDEWIAVQRDSRRDDAKGVVVSIHLQVLGAMERRSAVVLGDWRQMKRCCICGRPRGGWRGSRKKCSLCHKSGLPKHYYCDMTCARYHWTELGHRELHRRHAVCKE